VKIGLTYDLRSAYLAAGFGEEETAEFDREGTIDAIEAALIALGHETERIGHLPDLMERLLAGASWDLVFNTAEGLRGLGRESEVPALLEAWGIPYTFSDPLVSALTLHKGMTKRVLRDLGVATSDFRVVSNEAEAHAVDLPFPLFVKPVAEGTAKGIDARSRVAHRWELLDRCRSLRQAFGQAVLVEPFLPGREFTTSIVGTGAKARVVGTLEVALRDGAEANAYSYVNKEHCEELVDYSLAPVEWAERCAEVALAAWRGIGARDAGRVDLRLDAAGALQVLELNPLPGLHPEHSDLPMACSAVGIEYTELIRAIVESAAERRLRADQRPTRPPTVHTVSSSACAAGALSPSGSPVRAER
jgi:D-alanine-D-alanine ligase